MVERYSYLTKAGFIKCGGGEYVRYSDYAAAEARIAALEAQLAERVRIKPLEWRTSADGKMFAITPVGLGYSVFGSPLGDTWLLELQCGSVVTAEAHSSEEEAIGYAQADYERRIRSALEATPALQEVQE